MDSIILRKKFLEFFKARGHTVVPSSSLIPDDPSVLLTTAGMQQFKPYFIGKADPMKDFGSKNTASVQKSFRTSDIDEVGDESHLTFFEMLGNFSFGGYFKKEAIEYAHEFITKEMGLKIDYVSVFKGDNEVPPDAESEKVWKSLGIVNIRKFGREDNFWGPTGSEGPCGPTTEIYVKNVEGKDVELWNLVFNEYYCYPDKRLEKLKTPGVDTGMGLERLAMVVQKVPTIFETDLFTSLVKLLPEGLDIRIKRTLADHIRGIAFLISDGVRPSKDGRDYILRRLIRRVLVHKFQHDINRNVFVSLLSTIQKTYGDLYKEIEEKEISLVFWQEAEKFEPIIPNGIKEFKRRLALQKTSEKDSFIKSEQIAYDATILHQSFGFSLELIKDLLKEYGYKIDEIEFKKRIDEEFKKHQEISRAGQEKKFGGHGLILNTGELKAKDEAELKKVTRLHTATHVLQQALRDVLGKDVHQAGSDITAERTRFDFAFPRKLTAEELKKVEAIVNQKIKEDFPVQYQEMSKAEAEKTGALYFLRGKYPERVKVYFVGKTLETAWSKEFCGGPHVTHTGEIEKFKILKEEAVGQGTRRIRATVEP